MRFIVPAQSFATTGDRRLVIYDSLLVVKFKARALQAKACLLSPSFLAFLKNQIDFCKTGLFREASDYEEPEQGLPRAFVRAGHSYKGAGLVCDGPYSIVKKYWPRILGGNSSYSRRKFKSKNQLVLLINFMRLLCCQFAVCRGIPAYELEFSHQFADTDSTCQCRMA